ncbi:MAG: hypothetical protein ACE5OO_05750 [Candidatus Bathyarchaeia archaeon]
MRGRAYISILAVSATAALSAVMIWRTLSAGGDLGRMGLVGIFLASLLSHLTIVARDMFVPTFLPLTSVYSPLLLGAAAGWGGALGEMTTYLLGWGVAESLRENRGIAEDRVAGWIGRYGLWAVLLVSMSPLPDTPVILLAGSSRLPLRKLLLIEGVGKTAYYTLGAFVGGLIFSSLTDTLGSLPTSALVVAASIAFCVLVTWSRS